MVLGIPLGYLAARRKGGFLDNAGHRRLARRRRGPGVLPGLPAQVRLRGASSAGCRRPGGRSPDIDATRVTGFFVLDGLLTREWDAAWDALRHLILPCDRAGHHPVRGDLPDHPGRRCSTCRTRTTSAPPRPRACTAGTIRSRHVLRNAMLPVITIVGLQTGALLAGAVLTETVFAYPGLGEALAIGVHARRTTRCCRCSSWRPRPRLRDRQHASSTCRTRVIDPRIRTR